MTKTGQFAFHLSDLDRAAPLRDDPARLAEMLESDQARVLPLWRGKVQIEGDAALALAPVAHGHPILDHAAEAPIFLGLLGDTPWFAADVSAWSPDGIDDAAISTFVDRTEQSFPGSAKGARFVELRAHLTALEPSAAGIAATAKALTGWHSTHMFCSRCGSKSAAIQGGWQRQCPSCGARHFPRTDPVVIMLITNGNRVLVGRSHGWPEGMYSLLAGFVEPGETIEDAVRREVLEEAGVKVSRVGYVASQPWPFPASLMIGCQGLATTTEITVEETEIDDALWLTREDMVEVFAGRHPKVRPARQGAIAHWLLHRWIADRIPPLVGGIDE